MDEADVERQRDYFEVRVTHPNGRDWQVIYVPDSQDRLDLGDRLLHAIKALKSTAALKE